MVKDVIITIYLVIFKIIFTLCKAFPLKNKVTFVVSFGDNIKFVYEEIVRQRIAIKPVFLCSGPSAKQFKLYPGAETLSFETNVISDNLKAIYHLATSKYIIIDNYFGFLASANFKKEAQCIQLWHAAGAIKKFGLQDESVAKRSSVAQRRFHRVYRNFHKVVVGSDEMALVFKKAFGLGNQNILTTGIPRTDFFYNDELQKESRERLEHLGVTNNGKIKILYAPTYRDNELNQFKLTLDLELLHKHLGNRYEILLKLHPAIKKRISYENEFPGFVYDLSSSGFHINELLLITDYLITDYSSIPYEFSLLRKPMIFFAYDLDAYTKERGLWDEYENMVPGPVVTTTKEIIELIKSDNFDMIAIEDFSNYHNKFSRGRSSADLILYMFGEYDHEQTDNNSQFVHETGYDAASR
ncbi:CDP-glycerol glycerophosphotransferase family protein [Bacillus sp. V59.32b]|uniref:CDP-glycerol glycerophosphotransferase family protein n=1 Tax=Bacillus sp. V59.32b TaxID=1758642 RepID=UPI000E3E6327|nr:CDP-glycerol glycerophosphotransferase family protein [Bacillus sp. V59.32b]RFU66859.1 CDP-glycerol glycerophosphotransferase family protein [Bacillus sp. V59.32b]